jgi:hypothetical protein
MELEPLHEKRNSEMPCDSDLLKGEMWVKRKTPNFVNGVRQGFFE